MLQQELLRTVVEVLEGMAIEYMLTGSLASSMQGEPRSTHDIDLVTAIERTAAKRLLDLLPPPRFYLDEKNMLDAIDRLTMFSLIDADTGAKVDFWMLTGTPFDRSRFSRRSREGFLAWSCAFQAPKTRSWPSCTGPSCQEAARSFRRCLAGL